MPSAGPTLQGTHLIEVWHLYVCIYTRFLQQIWVPKAGLTL